MDLALSLFYFLLTSMLLTLMPGPDVIFVLTESLTKGVRTGMGVAFGLALGCLVHTTIAATGLSVLLVNSEIAFRLVKYAGAAYLLYLAIKSYGEKPLSVETNNPVQEQQPFGKLLQKGFLMNVLNPKVSLFFIAFLPQFAVMGNMNISVQLFLLGFIFMIQAALIFSGIAQLAGRLSPYLNKPQFWIITKWFKIVIFLMLALVLLFSEK